MKCNEWQLTVTSFKHSNLFCVTTVKTTLEDQFTINHALMYANLIFCFNKNWSKLGQWMKIHLNFFRNKNISCHGTCNLTSNKNLLHKKWKKTFSVLFMQIISIAIKIHFFTIPFSYLPFFIIPIVIAE